MQEGEREVKRVSEAPARAGGAPASLQSLLAHAWASGPFTASDAMRATGLTRSTTIEATEQLVVLGLLQELPDARAAGDYRTGRPARRFALRDDAAVLVGIDAGNAHATVAVADLRAQVLHIERGALRSDRAEAEERRAGVLALVDAALAAAGRDRGDVLAVCAGVPAPVDRAGRSPAHGDGFWQRMNADLVDALDWAPLRRVANDAALAAVAEGAMGGAVGATDYVALLAGARLGAGVVVDGVLLHGAHGGVGEMVAFDHVEGVGSADGLGAHAAALARAAVASGAIPASSALARIPTAALDGRAVLELAEAGDADAAAIAEQVGAVLARIVSVLASVYDPQRVIVAGAVSAGIATVVAAAGRAMPDRGHLPPPELLASTLGGDVVVLGAVAAARDDAVAGALRARRRA